MARDRYVEVRADEVLKDTGAAILFDFDGEKVWIPTSQLEDPGDYDEGDEGVTVVMTRWIAEQKGLL